MSTTTTDDEVNDTKCTPSFFNFFNIGVTEKCKEYNTEKKKKKEADDKVKREFTNVTPVSTSSQGSVQVDASTTTAKENPVPDSSKQPTTPGEPAASGQPAAPKIGGWFSRGGKRKSKAKKSRRKKRKLRKSRKSRK